MKKLIILILISVSFATAQEGNSAEAVVQKQLEMYNARNLEAFLETYSNTVKMYNFPKELRYDGKEKIRKVFGNLFKDNPDLHSHIEDRIVSGNKVIDHEKVTFSKDQPVKEFVVMYIVENGKITEVYFL